MQTVRKIFIQLLETYGAGYYSAGFAPSSRGGWSKIPQPDTRGRREDGFPYRSYDHPEDEYEIDDKETAIYMSQADLDDYVNKLNPDRIGASRMAMPGDNYDSARLAQNQQIGKGGYVPVQRELDVEEDEENNDVYLSEVLNFSQSEAFCSQRDDIIKFVVQSNAIEGYDVDPKDVASALDAISQGYPLSYATDNEFIKSHLSAIEVAQRIGKVSSINDIKKIHRAMGKDVLEVGAPGVLRMGGATSTKMGDTQYVPEENIAEALNWWVNTAYKMDPFEAHVSYELIHPFGDGNGRSGRIILLSLVNFDFKRVNSIITPISKYFRMLMRAGQKFTGEFWNQDLEEVTFSAYNQDSRQPDYGGGNAFFRKSSRNNGRDGIGSQIAHPGSNRWTSGMLKEPKKPWYEETEEEYAMKNLKELIVRSIKEISGGPQRGIRDPSASNGRFGGYSNSDNSWAKGILQPGGVTDKVPRFKDPDDDALLLIRSSDEYEDMLYGDYDENNM